MSTVGKLCSHAVVAIGCGASVAHAARLMREHNLGTLIVTETGQEGEAPVGIVTDRDLAVKVLAIVDQSPATVQPEP